jgi:peptidoglycan/LPS O-acetylase OafA/YrhL
VRLLPLYYVVLGAYCALILGLRLADPAAIEAFRERLPGYLLYCSNVYRSIEGPFSHAWSLAYEEQFYFVFGLAMAFAPRRLLVGVAAIASVLYLAPLAAAGAWDPRTNAVLRGLLFFPPSIVHGVLVGFVLATASGHRAASRLARPWISAALLAATIGLLCVERIRARPSSEGLVMLVIALLVTSCVLQPSLPVLGGRALSYVGKISYGIYLQHVLCRHVFVKASGAEHPAVVLAGMLAISIPLAHLSYRYFEAPLMRRCAPLCPRAGAAALRAERDRHAVRRVEQRTARRDVAVLALEVPGRSRREAEPRVRREVDLSHAGARRAQLLRRQDAVDLPPDA